MCPGTALCSRGTGGCGFAAWSGVLSVLVATACRPNGPSLRCRQGVRDVGFPDATAAEVRGLTWPLVRVRQVVRKRVMDIPTCEVHRGTSR